MENQASEGYRSKFPEVEHKICIHIVKEFSPNLIQSIMNFLQKSEEENIFVMENLRQKSYCVIYYDYPRNHIVNINMDIFPIHNIDTRK